MNRQISSPDVVSNFRYAIRPKKKTNLPRRIRHLVKAGLALVAMGAMCLLVLDTLTPDLTAKLMGRERAKKYGWQDTSPEKRSTAFWSRKKRHQDKAPAAFVGLGSPDISTGTNNSKSGRSSAHARSTHSRPAIKLASALTSSALKNRRELAALARKNGQQSPDLILLRLGRPQASATGHAPKPRYFRSVPKLRQSRSAITPAARSITERIKPSAARNIVTGSTTKPRQYIPAKREFGAEQTRKSGIGLSVDFPVARLRFKTTRGHNRRGRQMRAAQAQGKKRFRLASRFIASSHGRKPPRASAGFKSVVMAKPNRTGAARPANHDKARSIWSPAPTRSSVSKSTQDYSILKKKRYAILLIEEPGAPL